MQANIKLQLHLRLQYSGTYWLKAMLMKCIINSAFSDPRGSEHRLLGRFIQLHCDQGGNSICQIKT